MKDANRATRFLGAGYTCSESVLLAVSQEYDIELEHSHLAMCFGGGMGFMGEVCGAVSGGIMAVGLVLGPAENQQEFQKTMLPVQEFRRRFEAEMKTINCRELTGMDLAAPGGFEDFMKSDVPERVCAPAVDTAYRLVMEVLEERAPLP